MNRYNKRASFGELPAPQGTSILDAHMDKIFILTSEQIVITCCVHDISKFYLLWITKTYKAISLTFIKCLQHI